VGRKQKGSLRCESTIRSTRHSQRQFRVVGRPEVVDVRRCTQTLMKAACDPGGQTRDFSLIHPGQHNTTMNQRHLFTRRTFIKTSIGSFAGISLVPRHVLGGAGKTAPSETLLCAVIGTGGMGMRAQCHRLTPNHKPHSRSRRYPNRKEEENRPAGGCRRNLHSGNWNEASASRRRQSRRRRLVQRAGRGESDQDGLLS